MTIINQLQSNRVGDDTDDDDDNDDDDEDDDNDDDDGDDDDNDYQREKIVAVGRQIFDSNSLTK